MFRLDRSRPAGPQLEWKVGIFLVAAGLGLDGIYLEEGWLTGGAILVLLGGVLLRFPPRTFPEGDSDHAPGHDGGEAEEDGDPGRHGGLPR